MQERLRTERPPPHVRSHRDQGLQADQAPSTAVRREGVKWGCYPVPTPASSPLATSQPPQPTLPDPLNQLPRPPTASQPS